MPDGGSFPGDGPKTKGNTAGIVAILGVRQIGTNPSRGVSTGTTRGGISLFYTTSVPVGVK